MQAAQHKPCALKSKQHITTSLRAPRRVSHSHSKGRRSIHPVCSNEPQREGSIGIFETIKNVFSGKVNKKGDPPPGTPPGAAAGTQFIPYNVIRSNDNYTLRLYQVHPVVETEYGRREEGYLALGQYMDGANADGMRFAPTAPVVMCYEPKGAKRMQMFVGTLKGEEFNGTPTSVTQLPAPTDAGVQLAAAGGELIAVLRFEGYITPETAAAVRKQLVAAIKKDGMRLAPAEEGGYFRVAQYGQVYTLQTRVNEMMLRVEM